MAVGVCFSGGKDSALAALLLEPHYDVRLVGCTFGVGCAHDHARDAAASLDLPFDRVELDSDVADEAVERMVADGYPRNGIQAVHEHALERVADAYSALADGTRRDDRVPSVDRPAVQSLEDRHGVDYLRPLAGFGRSAIDDLVERLLVVETGPSDSVPKGDYESELRALVAAEHGRETVGEIFPAHVQSRVRGRA
jgi:predicted subunit of tRNA(5-methylaminomethyl-2-thiouridylate) methyltransferase